MNIQDIIQEWTAQQSNLSVSIFDSRASMGASLALEMESKLEGKNKSVVSLHHLNPLGLNTLSIERQLSGMLEIHRKACEKYH